MAREVTLYRVYPEKIMVSGDHVELLHHQNVVPIYEPDASVNEFAEAKVSLPVRVFHRTTGVHETERLYFALDQPLEDVLKSAEDRAMYYKGQMEIEEAKANEYFCQLWRAKTASLWQRIKAVFVGYGGLTG